jgi:hypothetical protein
MLKMILCKINQWGGIIVYLTSKMLKSCNNQNTMVFA